MHAAPAVHVTLAPSRIALVAVSIVAATTCAIALTLPWPPAPTALTLAATLAWAADRALVIALRRGVRAVRSIDVTADLHLCVGFGDGTTRCGRVEPGTCVTSRVTTLVWRPNGSVLARSVLILPDMLPADDFRRLRVLLRYARKDTTQGAPASHA